ncbi:MAG TPA: alanyl-tRNA editing protein [Iamia sp.]|nr:alanyl-tRNA editing protein [Iamia sp.]
MATDLLYLRDADLRACMATVVAVGAEGRRVALDRTALYPTGGGQPHDTGTLAGLPVTDVRKEGEHAWHTVGEGALPVVGDVVTGEVDADRRWALMRTHTALHVQLVNAEIAADRPIEVGFLPRSTAVEDEDLIRTTEPSRSARRPGRHGRPTPRLCRGARDLPSTAHVGRIRVVKTESEGKGNERLRIAVEDA